MLAPLILPKELGGVAEALTKAVREVEVLGAWPEEEPAFLAAAQPEALAKPLIKALHQELLKPAEASIAYLFRKEMEKRGRVRLGVASKASGKLEYLTGFDFVLEFNWTYWSQLTPPQRIALVDHELTHCSVTDKGAWTLVSHDVEEFGSIVRRWGLWTPDLVHFNAAIKATQMDLFAPASHA